MKKEEEKGLRRWLKKKVSMTQAVLVLFLITGGLSFAEAPTGRFLNNVWYFSESNTRTGWGGSRTIILPNDTYSTYAKDSGGELQLKSFDENWNKVGIFSTGYGMIRGLGDYGTAFGHFANAIGAGSTAVGREAYSKGENSTAIGTKAQADSEQGTALGGGTQAIAAQATALGNDTYSMGHSSIALGSDDTTPKTGGGYADSITKYDYDNYFKELYQKIDPKGTKYGFNTSNPNDLTYKNSRQYSPTLSRGIGSIAMGSRSIAYDNGSVAVGTLAFALKEGSTALGTKTRAEGIGAMALGNLSNVFSDYSVATGNKTQVLNEGGMAYGYQAYSAGEGALAIGREVSANAQLTDLAKIKAAYEKDTTSIDELRTAGDLAKNITTGTVNDVTGIVKQNDDKNYAIVLGNRAAATSQNSLAIGRSSFSLSDNSVAIGSFSYSDAKDAMAIGVGARAYDLAGQTGHTGISALAIGTNARATLENSVALGVGSRTDYTTSDLNKTGYAPKGALAVPTSAKTGVISVGRKGAERRVSNVASGYLNTDAANVGQLKALEDAINLNIAEKTGGGVKYLSTNKTAGDSAILEGKLKTTEDYHSYVEYVALKKTLEARVNLNKEEINNDSMTKIEEAIQKFEAAHPDFKGLQTITSIDTTAGTNDLENEKKYSTALEEVERLKKDALAKTPNGANVTDYHNADNSGAKGADSIAIGYDAETSVDAVDSVAIGKAAKVKTAKGIALGNNASVEATANSGIAIGENAQVSIKNSIAIGRNSKTTAKEMTPGGELVQGHLLTENAGVTKSVYAQFLNRRPVFTPNAGEVAVGNAETGTRRITGLAAGKSDTDAVNVGQYKALAEFQTIYTGDGDSKFERIVSSPKKLKFQGNSDITTKAVSQTGEDQIQFTLNKVAAITEAEKSSALVSTTKAVYDAVQEAKSSVEKADGEDIVTVTGTKSSDIAGNTFKVGINKDNLKATVGEDFARKDASNLSDANAKAWKDKLGVSNIDLNYKGNEEGEKKKVALSTGLTIQGEKKDNTETSGKNIWVESTTGGIINIKMADKPEFTEAKAGGIHLASNQMTGLTASKVAGNAVEHKQFTDAMAGKLANTANFTLKDESGNLYKAELEKSPEIIIQGNSTTKNIKTALKDNIMSIDLNDTITVKEASIAGVRFTNDGTKTTLNANGAKISNIADGIVAKDSKEAVNGGQLFTAKEETAAANTAATKAQGTANTALSKATINEGKIASNTTSISKNTKDIESHANQLATQATNITNNTSDIQKGFHFVAENPATTGGQTSVNRQLGESLTIAGDGKNVSTSIDKDAKVIINLKNNPKFGEITINDSGKITGLSNGTLDKDAVNLSQLRPLANAVNATVGADGSVTQAGYKVGDVTHNTIQDALSALKNSVPNGTITFTDGKNQSKEVGLGGTIQFKEKTEKENVKVELNPTNGIYTVSLVDAPTFAGKVSAQGFDAGNQKITNVAAGTSNLDAVNWAQLQEVKSGVISAVTLSLDSPVTYIAKVKDTDNAIKDEIIKKIGDKFYKTRDLDEHGQPKSGAKALEESEVATIKISTISKDGSITNTTRFTNVGPGDISASSTDAINGSQLKPILDALAMTWDDNNNSINSPKWIIGKETFNNIPSVIKGLATGKVGSFVLTDADANTIVRANDNKFYKVSEVDTTTMTAKDGAVEVKKEDIRYSALNPTAEEGKATTTPLQAGNLAEGTKPSDAVTVSQLTKLGLDPNAEAIKPVVTYDNDKKGTITLAGEESAGQNLGTKITNLRDGDLSTTSTDAVSGKQLYTVKEDLKGLKENADKGWNLGINKDAAKKVGYGDTVQFTSDSNLVITSTDEGDSKRIINIKTVDSPTFGKIKLENSKDGKNATITGLTNTTWNGEAITGRAATEDQLKSAVDSITSSNTETDKFSVKYDKKDDTSPDYSKISLKNAYDPSNPNSGTKITNLAKGEIGETSSDAINGSQIYDMSKTLGDLIGTTLDSDGKIQTPNFTEIDGEKPNSIKDALDKLGNKISTGNTVINEKVGTGLDGRDGKDGKNGESAAKGPTAQDGLNGKDLTSKVNALRNGEAGTVVYTDKDGIRLYKANNGSYYKASDIDLETGKEKKDAVAVEPARLHLVNPNGTTTKETVLSNLANGNIASGSKDAVTGDQLHKVASSLGDVGTDGSLTLKKIKFRGNIESSPNYDKSLGDQVDILGNSSVTAENLKNYEEKNVVTENTEKGIVIKFAKNPEFTSVNAIEKVSVGEKGKEGITLESKNDGKDNSIAFKKNPADANGKETGTGSITGLKDLDENSDGTSATNKNYVDSEVKKVSDAINGSDGLVGKVGTGLDGRDGQDGKNGKSAEKGPTGADGLNGKDLTSKINALRNGEAGTVVYTDAAGNRLYKGNDGNYYTADKIDLKTGEGTAGKHSEPVRLSLVNPDGKTVTETILGNVAKGSISSTSTDAINGSQLKDLADKVGLEVDPKDSTKLADPKLVPTKDSFVKDDKGDIYKKVTEDGKDKYYKLDPATGEFEKAETPSITGEKPVEPKLVDRINVLTALNNDLQAKANKGITFKGDNADGKAENETAVPLGGALNIKGATKDKTVDGTKYMGGNIRVESSSTGMLVYTKADPTFDSITLNKEGLKDSSAVRLSQLNALRKELNLAPISEKDPDGNGIVGDQRDPNASNGGNNPGTGTPSSGNDIDIRKNIGSLAEGEIGPVVYTTKEGERVVLEGDKFYKAEAVEGKLAHKDKWYDSSAVKVSGGKLYDLTTGKEVTGKDLEKFEVTAPEIYNKDSVKLSAVNPDGTTSTPTTLGNIADGKVAKDSKDAVNGGQLFAATGMTEGGKFADGRDGKSGMDANGNPVSDSAASKGNTGKDGLNGLNPNDKANALRNGEAGSVVYTNGAGDRLSKANDGKYYLSSDLNSDGSLKANAKVVEKVVSTVAQSDGTTSTPGIIRVGNGEVSATSTEAVNGSQLHATNSRIDNITANTDAKFEEQGKAISTNTERIQGVKNEIGHVGALGAALSALHPMQYDPLQKNQVMAGLGHYRDKQAVAVGVTHYFNENLMMTAGVSVGNENRVKTMANVGITWKIGKDDDREDLPERYKEGPIGSIYIMQQEMETVLQENRSQKEKLERQDSKILEQGGQLLEQQSRIEKLEKQLEMLLKGR